MLPSGHGQIKDAPEFEKIKRFNGGFCMKCSQIKNHIIDYVLNELDPERQIKVNEHLAICSRCRDELQRTEAMIDGFRGATRFEPTPAVFGKITEQITVPRPKRTRFLGMPRSLVYTFAAFIFGVVIMIGLSVMLPVPAALGTQEAGQVTIFSIAGAGGKVGFVISLITRIRDIIWTIVGVGYMYHKGLKRLVKSVLKPKKQKIKWNF